MRGSKFKSPTPTHPRVYNIYIHLYVRIRNTLESNQPTGNKKKYRISAVQRRTLIDIRLLLCLVLLLSFSHLQGVFSDDDEEDAKHLKCNWKSQNRTEPTIIKAIIPTKSKRNNKWMYYVDICVGQGNIFGVVVEVKWKTRRKIHKTVEDRSYGFQNEEDCASLSARRRLVYGHQLDGGLAIAQLYSCHY